MTIATLGFPLWLRATHWINVLFLGLLVRAGIQILGAYPRLYWQDSSTPGKEWLKFTRKPIPKDRLWISLEQETDVPAVLGQPGGNNLGLGRHWHFFAVLFWILNGVVYVVLLFVTGEWSRLIPTSWSIFPAAWQTFLTYATFHLPPASAMNWQPLSVAHGAPLRLRVETQLGFKMVKWLRAIELVEDYATTGDGQGGSQEDTMYYEQAVSI